MRDPADRKPPTIRPPMTLEDLRELCAIDRCRRRTDLIPFAGVLICGDDFEKFVAGRDRLEAAIDVHAQVDPLRRLAQEGATDDEGHEEVSRRTA